MIRKTLLAAATAGALLASGIATAKDGIYVNAQLAIADVDGFDDNGITAVVTGGFPLAAKGFSIEAELTKSLVAAETDFNVPFFGTETVEIDYFSLGGYGVYAMPLGNSPANLRLRAGLVYTDWEVEGNSDSEIGLSLGAGFTFGLSRTMNFIAEFTHTDVDDGDIDHLSAGVQFAL